MHSSPQIQSLSSHAVRRLFWTVGIAAGFCGTALAEERFVLKVAGRNDLTSTATQSRQKLIITDPQQQTFVYQRQPRLDTPDGRYLGYFSQAAGQALRWPVNDAGSMLIGSPDGQNWRQSQQQIQAMRVPAPQNRGPVTARRPVVNSPAGNNPPDPNLPRDAGKQQRYAGPMEVAYTPAGKQSLDVGFIDQQGRLQAYRGWRDRWQPYPIPNPPAGKPTGLVPGAPLSLVSQDGQKPPLAYTVNSGGRLVEIGNGHQIRPVANDVEFAPGSHLFTRSDNAGTEGFAVDKQGRLWNLDLARGRHQLIDRTAGRFGAGAPISVVSPSNNRRAAHDLYLVDRRGQILNYRNTGGGWNGPNAVAAGFPPNAPIAATVQTSNTTSQVRLAGVDARGHVQMLEPTRGRWQAVPVRGAILPPGSPLAFTNTGGDLSLIGFGQGGVWNAWTNAAGGWNQTTLSRGFFAGAPVAADPFSQTAFGVDATGRLIADGYWDGDWHPYLLQPGASYAAPLVQRQVALNTALTPATIYFDNPSQEELVVQMVYPFAPVPPEQFNIPAGGSVARRISRSGGGTLNEVHLVPGPYGRWVPQSMSLPIPPQPGPTLVVWAKRVTYKYIDPKHISVLPDFDLKNNVSLGVFDLPPGPYLVSGTHFNVYAEAVSRWNRGAAQFFGPPIPDPDVGVRLYHDNNRGVPSETYQPQPAPTTSIPQNPPSSTVPQQPADKPPLPAPPTDSSQDNPDKSKDTDTGPILPPLPR